MSLEQDRASLRDILNRLSIRRGDFVLASSQRSNIYIDARSNADLDVSDP